MNKERLLEINTRLEKELAEYCVCSENCVRDECDHYPLRVATITMINFIKGVYNEL